MPAGGVIQPDGRPPRAKGVGKTARRHDLEAPATPGVGNSDMQHGDRQRLEQAQRAAPRPKKQNGVAASKGAPARRRRKSTNAMESPDPIDFAASRPGRSFDASGTRPTGPPVDPTPWMPMIREMAIDPGVGGNIAAAYVRMLTARRQQPLGPSVSVVNLNEIEDILLGE